VEQLKALEDDEPHETHTVEIVVQNKNADVSFKVYCGEEMIMMELFDEDLHEDGRQGG
jgi:hypothetical protein